MISFLKNRLLSALMDVIFLRYALRMWARVWMRRRVRTALKTDRKLLVVFILFDAAIWKFDQTYILLKNSTEFDPIIWIWTNRYKEADKMEGCMQLCRSRGYSFVNASELSESEILQEYKKVSFLFFSAPYRWSSPSVFFKTRRKDRPFHCYVPYAFNVSDLTQQQYGQWFFQNLDINFHPSNLHRKIHISEGNWPWVKEEVSGYPGIEPFAFTEGECNTKKPIIIYAPHHTISNENNFNLSYATFEHFGEFLKALALETKEQVDWVFKPHPLLYNKLLIHPEWGKEKTNKYYAFWEDNARCEDGDYVELFKSARGMIHDSGSFLAEFLATGQPVMYLLDEHNTQPRLNEFGFLCLKQCYPGRSTVEIRRFVQEVILQGDDAMKDERVNFIRSEEYGQRHQSSSEMILDSIRRFLGVRKKG